MNIIHTLVPTKIPTAAAISNGTMICPSSISYVRIICSNVFYKSLKFRDQSYLVDNAKLAIIGGFVTAVVLSVVVLLL